MTVKQLSDRANMAAIRARRYPVPVGPVLRVVEQWLADETERERWEPNGNRHDNNVLLSPTERLAATVGMTGDGLRRQLRRLRYEATHCSVETADKLIAATYGPDMWRTDPELAAVHASLPTGDPDEPLLTETEVWEWAAGYWGSLTVQQREQRANDFSLMAEWLGLGHQDRRAA